MIVLSAPKGVRPSQPIQRSKLVIADTTPGLGGFKPLLDCLVAASKRNPGGLGFIINDNPLAMTDPAC
jgi:hypothetical protein